MYLQVEEALGVVANVEAEALLPKVIKAPSASAPTVVVVGVGVAKPQPPE